MTIKAEDAPVQLLQLGTCIDGGALELVEVLGVGGYGIVYLARETGPANRWFAVKCLLHNRPQSSTRTKAHIREIALHRLSSYHPGIIKLHRVVEDEDRTYMIMDYAPDHDLFTQILDNRRYLGNDALIKDVILQLINAVEYCHSLGIYHRDLKPENVLCFDYGTRVAITDFGLATTEKVSDEMHTGSIYHMSPECQGMEFSTGRYSPMFNDVWSLGIIFLNLATGRNPWRKATLDDETFCEYLRSPYQFFQSVLPVSMEVNELLARVLHVDWMERMTLAEFREDMESIENIYMPGAVFEGNQARCPWEVDPIDSTAVNEACYYRSEEVLKSHWSEISQRECETEMEPHSDWASDFEELDFRPYNWSKGGGLNTLNGGEVVRILSSQRSSTSSASSEELSLSTPGDTEYRFPEMYSCGTTADLALKADEYKQLGGPEKDGLASSAAERVLLDMDDSSSSFFTMPLLPRIGGMGIDGIY